MDAVSELLEAVNTFDDGALSTYLETIDVKEFREAVKALGQRQTTTIEQFQLRFMAIQTLHLTTTSAAACHPVKHDSKALFRDLTDYINSAKT